MADKNVRPPLTSDAWHQILILANHPALVHHAAMGFYRTAALPMLHRMDAEAAHERAAKGLRLAQGNPAGRAALRKIAGAVPAGPVEFCGLRFPNCLGVAAGFDKDARVAAGLALLGFGHVEVGTITPRPQAGNPKPRVFRLSESDAVINRMGFPNGGVEAAMPRLNILAGAKRDWILGVSLGKQKETPLEAAADDYLALMRAVYPHADYLAINISSPNTPGLRELQKSGYLGQLLSRLMAESASLARGHKLSPRPLLVKIAPDLEDADLRDTLDGIQGAGVAGIIATNTTLSRDGATGPAAAEQGGLSGRPLAEKSTLMIARIAELTGGKLPIIGVGGVFTADDARRKLDAGAALVQVYTGMIYEGPGIAGRILRGLAKEG